jgi:hypothetical protein
LKSLNQYRLPTVHFLWSNLVLNRFIHSFDIKMSIDRKFFYMPNIFIYDNNYVLIFISFGMFTRSYSIFYFFEYVTISNKYRKTNWRLDFFFNNRAWWDKLTREWTQAQQQNHPRNEEKCNQLEKRDDDDDNDRKSERKENFFFEKEISSAVRRQSTWLSEMTKKNLDYQ